MYGRDTGPGRGITDQRGRTSFNERKCNCKGYLLVLPLLGERGKQRVFELQLALPLEFPPTTGSGFPRNGYGSDS